MPALAILAALLALVALGYVRAWRSRRRLEVRARLLETLAVACRRGRALPPLLAAAAREQRPAARRALEAVHTGLDEGLGLADALACAGSRFVGQDVVGAVRAAQGSAALAPTLAALAGDDGRALQLRHRLYLVALYPALLVLLAAGLVGGLTAWARLLSGWSRRPPLSEAFAYPVLWLGLGSAVAWVVGDWLHRRGRLPGSGLLSLARVLRSAGLLVQAGLPLPEALRRAAPATRRGDLARRAREAADLLEAGEDLGRAHRRLGLPRAWVLRLEAARGAGTLLLDLSTRCLDRQRRRGERLARFTLPVVLLVVGVVVLLDFEAVMATLLSAQQEAQRGLRLW